MKLNSDNYFQSVIAGYLKPGEPFYGVYMSHTIWHSGKAPKHSGKASPSATLGEGLLGTLLTVKRPSPNAKSRALGETFPECHAPSRGRFNAIGTISRFYTLPRVQHSGKKFSFFKKTSSPSATLGEEIHFLNLFPECHMPRHSGKPPSIF
jgi:hypothetical protein